jgi:hypothetical protein
MLFFVDLLSLYSDISRLAQSLLVVSIKDTVVKLGSISLFCIINIIFSH